MSSVARKVLREDRRSKYLPIALLASLLVAYAVNAMDRQLYPVIASDVREHYGFELSSSGFLSTVFTLGMGIAGIPTGILLAKLSRKNVAMVGLAIFSLATLMTAYAAGFWSLTFYRFISGLGEAMQFTAIVAIATAYFSTRKALAVGAVNFTFGVGALVGPVLGAALTANGSWRTPLITFAAVGGVILVVNAVTLRRWFTEAGAGDTQGDATHRNDGIDTGAATLAERNPALLAGATALTGFALYSYIGLYPSYLREELGYSQAAAGLALSMYGLGALFSLIGGWLGDRFDFRRVIAGGMFAAAIIGYLLFSGITSLPMQMILSLSFGLAGSGVVWANLVASTVKVMKPSKGALGAGIAVTSLYVPAGFAGFAMGAAAVAWSWSTGALALISCLLVCAIPLVCCVKLAELPPRSRVDLTSSH